MKKFYKFLVVIIYYFFLKYFNLCYNKYGDNMDKKTRIKSILFLYITLGFTMVIFKDHNYNDNDYVIYDNDIEPYGAYKKGNIYIGNHEYIESIKGKIHVGDVLIEQGYKTCDGYFDPNYKIYSSYLITDKDDRNTILNVLNIYNTEVNFEFNRTLESMRVEWTIHNILYNMGIERNRTKDVDLNNGDENIYSNPVLKKLIK